MSELPDCTYSVGFNEKAHTFRPLNNTTIYCKRCGHHIEIGGVGNDKYDSQMDGKNAEIRALRNELLAWKQWFNSGPLKNILQHGLYNVLVPHVNDEGMRVELVDAILHRIKNEIEMYRNT